MVRRGTLPRAALLVATCTVVIGTWGCGRLGYDPSEPFVDDTKGSGSIDGGGSNDARSIDAADLDAPGGDATHDGGDSDSDAATADETTADASPDVDDPADVAAAPDAVPDDARDAGPEGCGAMSY